MFIIVSAFLIYFCNFSLSAIYSSYECNNGLVRYAKLNATSELPDRTAKNAILNGENAWSASSNDFGQYLVIDLGRSMNVTRIETQGRALSSEFVKEFTVSYGTNGYDYVDYKDISGTKKTFQANTDGNKAVLNEFEVPIIAQFIRINPVRWNGRISLRVELYGCDYESDLVYFNGSAFIKRDYLHEPIKSYKDFIRFRFKTAHENGLLMYSHGLQGDLFALVIQKNKMYLHIDFGLERITTLKVGSLLDDDLWHDVVINRNLEHVELSVDRVKVEKKVQGSFYRLDLDRGLFIGGLPFRKTVIGDVQNFTGCIENLYVNSTNFIADAKYAFQDNIYSWRFYKTDGVLFSCPEPREIPVTFTSSKSYVRLNGYEGIKTMNVTLNFRTFEDEGLLIYHTFMSRGFVKVFLEYGKIKIMLTPNKNDLLYTPVYDNFNKKFNDGEWHSLVFTMAKNLIVITIDGQSMRTIRSLEFLTGLIYFIAGHPDLKDVGFIGCMKSIGIDGNYRQPPDWTKDQYCCQNSVIFATCLMNDKCDPSPCQNNGICYQNSKEFSCDCTNTGYTGAVCHTPLHPLSCLAYKNINSLTDSQLEVRIMIDIDGSGPMQPFQVTCYYLANGDVLTRVHHSNESYIHVNSVNYSLPGSFIYDLQYDAGFAQMETLVNRSKSCHQNMIFKCKSLSLFNSPYKSDHVNDFNPYSYWTNSHNQRMDYWGGGVPGSKKCYCGVHNNCIDRSKFCNCDSQLDSWQEDAGDVFIKEHLPIRQIRVGGIISSGDYSREAMFKIGPLVCEGDNIYDNTITFRLSDAVLMLPTDHLETSTDIYFEFKTTIEDAVFFHSRGSSDFIKLSIIGGNKIVFEYQTVSGTVAVNLPTSGRLADNRWHSIFVERNRKEAKILLDGALSEKTRESDGLIRPLVLGDVLIFGADADQKNGFVGCIRALQINGQLVNMKSFGKIFKMYGLSEGCIGKCDSSPCLNNGTCFEHYMGYTCDCRWSSFKGPICADDIGVTMRSNSMIKYDFMGSWRSTISESIRVGFTTPNPKGFLLGLFSNISGEYLTVMVSNSGHLRVVFDFGFERQEIIYPDKHFGIGQYHDVHISRKDSGATMVLKVDNYPPKEYNFNIKLSADAQFNNVQYLYIGKNETMSEGFIGCISRVEFDDIYPLKLLFQQNPPPNVRSLGGFIREDYCGVEPVTHPPDVIETKPLPELDQEKLLKAYNQANTALWSSLFILLILALIVLGLFGSHYIANYKGEYLTQEDVGADFALDSDMAVINSITGHQVQKKKEWFI